MLPMASQIIVLVFMVVAGVIVGFMFDIYRVIRSLARPSRQISVVMDLAFWVMVTPIVFVILVASNWGQLRLYVFLGMALGLFCYFQLLSQTVVWTLMQIFRGLMHKITMAVCAVMRGISGCAMMWGNFARRFRGLRRPAMARRRCFFRGGRLWPFCRR